LAAVRTLLEEDAQVFADRRNHASLVDGVRLALAEAPGRSVRYYRHRDFADLERLLAQSDPQRPRWIVTDSVFSMDGTCTRPEHILELARRYSAQLLVDEAHATGVLGPYGSGLFSLPLVDSAASPPPDQDSGFAAASGRAPRMCIVGTLSKSLASQGGFVIGSWDDTERLIQGARSLIYSTGLAGSSVAAALAAIPIARCEAWRRDTLRSHVQTLHSALRQQGWRTIGDPDAPLLAVIVGDHLAAERIAANLDQHGIWAPAIRPPTVKPLECRIRLSPTATMTAEDIQQIVAAFAASRVPQ
jgi:8-amino-7-oxononanoate synthase